MMTVGNALPNWTYRVFHLVMALGWVDFEMDSSPGGWAATVDIYCPSRTVKPPKSESTQTKSAIR